MAWCPNCKTEYRDGIKKCADCGATLVKELKDEANVCIAFISEREQAERFIQFLNYSNLYSCQMEYDSNEGAYAILVTQEEETEAQKLFAAFRISETKNLSEETAATASGRSLSSTKDMHSATSDFTEESEEETVIPLSKMIPESSLTYVKKEDRYNDVKSSAYIFLVFGILGLIFTGLNMAGVLSLLNSWIQYIVLGATCIAFILISIQSFRKSKQLFTEIDHETELTNQINDWLANNITASTLAPFNDPTSSDEVNFFRKIEYIKSSLTEHFQVDNEAYIDQLIEDFYNKTFE